MKNDSCKRIRKPVVAACAGLALMLSALPGPTSCFAQTPELSTPTALKLGWRVSCQAYSLRDKTFFEMVDVLSSMGILNIEGLDNGVKMSTTDGTPVDFRMSAAKRAELKKYMAGKGVKMPSYFVGYNHASKTDPKLWEFFKEMGVEVFNCDQEPKLLATMDKQSKEYTIPVTIHNGPKGNSSYWNSDDAIKLIDAEGELPMIGFCPDIGHWARSNLDVIKSITAYHNNRPIHIIHLRDIRKNSTSDTVLGTGIVPCKEILDSLYAWKWQGIITFEIELANSKNISWIIDSCARYIEKYAKSKATSTVASHSPNALSYQGAANLFVTAGGDGSTRKHGPQVIYTVSGKKVGGGDAAPSSRKPLVPPGAYIVR